MNDVCITDISGYVEFKAKTLCKELSENFDLHKCDELHKTLGDLLKLQTKSVAIPSVGELASEPYEKAEVPPPEKKIKPKRNRVKWGERQAIIDLILDRFYEESKTGKQEFCFYGKDFGVTELYLQNQIFGTINSNRKKKKRFPNLKIKYITIPGGVICHIGRKE